MRSEMLCVCVNGLVVNLGESHFQSLLYSVSQNVDLSF